MRRVNLWFYVGLGFSFFVVCSGLLVLFWPNVFPAVIVTSIVIAAPLWWWVSPANRIVYQKVTGELQCDRRYCERVFAHQADLAHHELTDHSMREE